jgi:hypothetical protein
MINETCQLIRAQVKRDYPVLGDTTRWRFSASTVLFVTALQARWRGQRARKMFRQSIAEIKVGARRRTIAMKREMLRGSGAVVEMTPLEVVIEEDFDPLEVVPDEDFGTETNREEKSG